MNIIAMAGETDPFFKDWLRTREGQKMKCTLDAATVFSTVIYGNGLLLQAEPANVGIAVPGCVGNECRV